MNSAPNEEKTNTRMPGAGLEEAEHDTGMQRRREFLCRALHEAYRHKGRLSRNETVSRWERKIGDPGISDLQQLHERRPAG